MPSVLLSDLSNVCGQALARHFLDKGYTVYGLRAHDLPQALGAVVALAQDATSEGQVRELAAHLQAKGGVDALILTAREQARTTVADGPEEDFDRVMLYNTKTAFLLCQHIGGLMARAGKGAVVFIGSIHTEKPTGAMPAFSCSMGALKMLMRECALQLGRRGVHAALIELGPLAGDELLMDSELTPIYDGFEKSIPRGRACTGEELGGIVDMLISTPMLNGADMRADAGFTLKYFDR